MKNSIELPDARSGLAFLPAAWSRHAPVSLLAPAALATFSPAFHEACLLDREGLAAGEVWRLWTGHLAHFSMSHLLADSVVFSVLCVALARAGELRLGRLLVFGAAVLSLSLLAVDSSLARYGGLSALNALLVGRLALRWFKMGGWQRVFGLALLAAAIGKFWLDLAGLSRPLAQFHSVAVLPSHLSHWLGLFWGLGLPVSAPAERIGGIRRSCCVVRGEFASSRGLHEPPRVT